MFQEILDWVTLIAGIFTIFAASATLYAVWIAHTTWKTWKEQHNYSFERDKVFELELAADQLFKEGIYYILTIKEIVKSKLAGNFDQNLIEKELKLRLTNLQNCLKQYDLKLSSLDVLQIKYDKKILETAEEVGGHFDNIVNKMYGESEPQKALKDFDNIYIRQANSARILVLNHLNEVRKQI